MGTWSYHHYYGRKLKSSEIKKEIKNREFPSCIVHAISIQKWNEAYVAFSSPKDPEKIHAAVVKIAWHTNSEIAFKVMDEECGPYYYNCPKKILKMLSPTECKNAIEWREDCWSKFKKS